MSDDFLSLYLSYTEDTEVPRFFSRWAALSLVAAYLGRQVHLKLGHFDIHPNLYTMLIGSPGTRKSTAIKTAKNLLTNVGYDYFSAERTSKEKFLLDLSGEGVNGVDIMEQNLFGAQDAPAEMYIAADEFNDYIGTGNIEFISMLGSLWDYKGTYTNRIKNGKSVSINNPTINIFGGNTPTGFSLAFPPEIIGQGFFSRLLLIYGEPSGKKIPFPTSPPQEKTQQLMDALVRIKKEVFGEMKIAEDTQQLLSKIYTTWDGIDDVRFEHYANRRFTHLLKLCLICSSIRYSTSISVTDVILANTILSYTERLMPKALGEFGKAKDSDVVHKVMQLLDKATKPMTAADLFVHVQADVGKMEILLEMLRNLMRAHKVQSISGGFLPKKKAVIQKLDGTVDFNLLTQEERDTHV